MCPLLGLCYTDPAQYLVTAGQDPDDLDHDLSVRRLQKTFRQKEKNNNTAHDTQGWCTSVQVYPIHRRRVIRDS